LLLGYNIFKGANSDESRRRIASLPIPDFRQLDPRIDERLNEILQRTLARKVDARYPVSEELLYDLEYFIYHKGYGPTNETLGRFVRELFGQSIASPSSKGRTDLLEHTARIAATA
jgi:serine/threonine-protein kinase